MKRLLVLLTGSLVLLVLYNSSVTAHNWGSGVWGPPSVGCLTEDVASECTADNETQYVYIYSSVPTAFKVAVQNTVAQDYFPINEFYAYTTFDLNVADAYVITGDTTGLGTWAYSTCPIGAVHGGGTGEYEYCKRQALRIDPAKQRAQDCLSSSFCSDWIACHEVGHTTGLQHPGSSPDTSASRVTCMDYDEDTEDPGSHDEEHLTDCYPRPIPAPATVTPHCSNLD